MYQLDFFQVYLGAKGTEKTDKQSQLGVYFEVVENLVRKLFGLNHRVYFDNLYTSIPLLLWLHSKGVYCCGTLRSNRKYIPDLIKEPGKMIRGQYKICQDENNPNLTVVAWMDTKVHVTKLIQIASFSLDM